MKVTTKISPNHNTGRSGCAITRITPHCIVGQVPAEECARWFSDPKRQASANYIIGKDGEVVYNVLETDRAWTSSSKENDDRAITIECASDTKPPYAFNDKVYETLIELTADIIKRNGRKRLKWIPTKNDALNYKVPNDEMIITLHRWFAARECPGDWLVDHMGDYVSRVNAKLGANEPKPSDNVSTMYYVQCGAFKNKANAEQLVKDLKAKGFEAIIKE